jgi:hypothetical protein
MMTREQWQRCAARYQAQREADIVRANRAWCQLALMAFAGIGACVMVIL